MRRLVIVVTCWLLLFTFLLVDVFPFEEFLLLFLRLLQPLALLLFVLFGVELLDCFLLQLQAHVFLDFLLFVFLVLLPHPVIYILGLFALFNRLFSFFNVLDLYFFRLVGTLVALGCLLN